MKNKLLSLLLVVTLLAVTISVGLPSSLAADGENLLANGDFDQYSGNTPTDWRVTTNQANAEIVEDVELPNGEKVNAIKYVHTGNGKKGNRLLSPVVKIEKNTAYTMTFWVKAKNSAGFTVSMYEPKYKDKNNASQTAENALEGQNIYTYNHNSGTSRVIRTDITHRWAIGETGTLLNEGDSMFITRTSSNLADYKTITPDFPAETRQGEWVQVIHTFKTGNDPAHEAEIAYEFKQYTFETGGEVWISNLKMQAVKDEYDGYYTPTVNDDKLGVTSKEIPYVNGQPVTITAEAFGENVFEGWFLGEELVSKDAEFTFTYDPENPFIYQARFKKADYGIDGSFENYTNGKVLSEVAYLTSGTWSEDMFLGSSKDGENLYFADSTYTGDYRKFLITNEQAHTGNYSAKYTNPWGYFGRKFTGLSKNTDYIVSFYAMYKGATSTPAGVSNILVTDAGMGATYKDGSGSIKKRGISNGALAEVNPAAGFEKVWQKYEVEFNTADSTEVILWANSAGNASVLYVDNISIKRPPYKYKPAVNNPDYGFVEPSTIPCVEGDEITVTAKSTNSGKFLGWYKGTELVCKTSAYTFNFSSDALNLEARFEEGETSISNPGAEGYENGKLLAQLKHTLDINKEDSGWTQTTFLETTKDGDGIYYMESTNGGTYRKLSVTSAFAHNGNKSFLFEGLYGSMARKFTGLKKNTDYVISYYGMVGAEDTSATFGSIKVSTTNASFYNPDKSTNIATLIATSNKTYNSVGEWTKDSIKFNSGDNTEVLLWIAHSGTGKIYIDDFTIGYPVSVSVSADLGGDVSTSISSSDKYLIKGEQVDVKATPYEGNTFAGWYTSKGELLSTNTTYSFTANEDTNVVARFDGYNKPAIDLFAINGNDGTFENGTVDGWEFYSSSVVDSVDWCKAIPTTTQPYEGNKSLQITSRYRNTALPINGLSENTNYRLSFWILQLEDLTKSELPHMAVVGPNDKDLSTAGIVLAQAKKIKTATGWNKIDLYFNTGDNTSVNFVLRYNAESTTNDLDKLFIDNFSLVTYSGAEEIVNGSFDDGKDSWIQNGTAAEENGNKVLNLEANKMTYQNLEVDDFAAYTVTFKAKGELTAAAINIGNLSMSAKNFISSTSYVDVNGTEWNEYTYEVFTGIHKGMTFAFKAGAAGASIDDVKVVKRPESSGAILEKIDFENVERFSISEASANLGYSIYTATDANDTNVYAGSKSLKFTYNELLKDSLLLLDEGWLSYQPGIGNNYKISFKYKIEGGKEGGFINIAPARTGEFGTDTGFEHLALDTEWKTVTFYVNNTIYGALKLKINNLAGGTFSNFYIDDIEISVAPAMVMEENSKISYCEELYNTIENGGFEEAISNANWKNLPATAKRVKGDALKASYFLRVGAGTKYILAVEAEPSTEYYFGASVRGTSKTVGSIGVTVDPEGTVYYANRDEEPASIVKFDSKNTGWKRGGFKFITDAVGKAYICIDVEKGQLDIDSVMLFTSDFGYRYDPNDYTVYVDYDYDNLKSTTTVVNGGYGAQPYFKEGIDADGDGVIDIITDDSDSPSTGDSVTMPVMVIILAVLASAAMLFIRKRKEGTE